MNSFFIKYRFFRMRQRSRPDRKFVAALRQTLETRGYVEQRLRWALLSWKTSLATLGLMGSLAMATATYAYASPNVLPDHPLYPIRQTLESVELRFAHTPKERKTIRLQHLYRRTQELEAMKLHKRKLPPQRARVLLQQVARVFHAIQLNTSTSTVMTISGHEQADADIQAHGQTTTSTLQDQDASQASTTTKSDRDLRRIDHLLRIQAERVEQDVQELEHEDAHDAHENGSASSTLSD